MDAATVMVTNDGQPYITDWNRIAEIGQGGNGYVVSQQLKLINEKLKKYIESVDSSKLDQTLKKISKNL